HVGADSVVARESQLESATQRGAGDGGDAGTRQPGQLVKHRLKASARFGDGVAVSRLGDHLQVGASDPLLRLAADDDHTAQVVPGSCGADRVAQRFDDVLVDGVDLVVWSIQDDAADAVGAGRLEPNRGGCRNGAHSRSSTMAAPTPPAAHTETSP